MGRNDWYRNTEWNDDIRDTFLKRLKRSKTEYNKAQYAYIQASSLSQTGDEKNVRAALELTDIMLNECPAPEHLPSIYKVRADCYDMLGDIISAANAWRNCVRAESRDQGIMVDAALYFAGFIVKRELATYYLEALSYLRPSASMVFSQRQFEQAAIFAVIFNHLCLFRRARRWAKTALEIHKSTGAEVDCNQAVSSALEPTPSILEKLERIREDDHNLFHEYVKRVAKVLRRRTDQIFSPNIK